MRVHLVAAVAIVGAAILSGCSDGGSNATPSATDGATVSPTASAAVTTPVQTSAPTPTTAREPEMQVYDVPAGSHPHDVAPAENGVYGWLDPATGDMQVFDAPQGRGPYGITATPSGDIYYVSLAGSYLGVVDRRLHPGEVTVIEPPTANQGARRVWSDSQGRLWVSEWNAGEVGMYDPATGTWREWPLPGEGAQVYSVYVDENDGVWLTDFTTNAIVLFDPETETFISFPLPDSPANVRQMLGRPGEVWGAESAADRLVVIRY